MAVGCFWCHEYVWVLRTVRKLFLKEQTTDTSVISNKIYLMMFYWYWLLFVINRINVHWSAAKSVFQTLYAIFFSNKHSECEQNFIICGCINYFWEEKISWIWFMHHFIWYLQPSIYYPLTLCSREEKNRRRLLQTNIFMVVKRKNT